MNSRFRTLPEPYVGPSSNIVFSSAAALFLVFFFLPNLLPSTNTHLNGRLGWSVAPGEEVDAVEGRLVEGDKRENFFLVAVSVEIVWARAKTVWAEVETVWAEVEAVWAGVEAVWAEVEAVWEGAATGSYMHDGGKA